MNQKKKECIISAAILNCKYFSCNRYPKLKSKVLVFDMKHSRESWKHLFIGISRHDNVADTHRLDFCLHLGLIYNVYNLHDNWDNLRTPLNPQIQGLINNSKSFSSLVSCDLTLKFCESLVSWEKWRKVEKSWEKLRHSYNKIKQKNGTMYVIRSRFKRE